MRNPSVPLREVCDFVYGDSLKEENRKPGKFPVFGSNGLVGWHDQPTTNGPTIIIGRKGSIGEINWSDLPCFPIDTTYYIEKTKLPCDLRWLFYALKHLDLTRFNKSAAIPGLSREDAYEKKIIWPSLPEQKRIAGMLAEADRLRRTRRYALELSETFLPTAFLKLFKNLPLQSPKTVGDLAANKPGAIRTGPFGSQLLHSEFTESGVAVLGIDNAVNNRFEWDERRYITMPKYEELKRYTVYPGDVLITIMGTCGRCAIVPDEIPPAINTKHLCCITLDPSKCLPTYLQGAFLYQPSVQRQLHTATKGAIMDGLNMGIIERLHIPLPPLLEQRRYVALVSQHDRLMSKQREALRQAEDLFNSMLNMFYSN